VSNHTTTRTSRVARTVVASLASALAAAAALTGLGTTPARAADRQPGTEPITGTPPRPQGDRQRSHRHRHDRTVNRSEERFRACSDH
jgi:hypothetical protein